MIDLCSINRAITETLREKMKNTMFENTPIISYDITEGFERPSIKIELDNSNLELLNSNYLNRSLTVRIYFFASDLKKYKIENLKAQDMIELTFMRGINTEHGHIAVNDIESMVVDTVLEVSFDIDINYAHDFDSDEDYEYMEDLEIKL